MADREVRHPWRALFAVICFMVLLWFELKLELNGYLRAVLNGALVVPFILVLASSMDGVPRSFVWMGCTMMSAMTTSFLVALEAVKDIGIEDELLQSAFIFGSQAVAGAIAAGTCLYVGRRLERRVKE